MHFLVLAWDKTDEDGVARRDASRAAHTETITALHQAGAVVLGAGILDDAGVVRGSIIVMDFPDRAAVDEYLAGEPFQTAGVWETVEVHELRVPPMYLPG
ncbi:MAG: YciI family protein [Acidimicrobiia bacterium]